VASCLQYAFPFVAIVSSFWRHQLEPSFEDGEEQNCGHSSHERDDMSKQMLLGGVWSAVESVLEFD